MSTPHIVWIVLWDAKTIQPDLTVFDTQEQAEAFARACAQEYGSVEPWYITETVYDEETNNGWSLYISYGFYRSDHFIVMRREVQTHEP